MARAVARAASDAVRAIRKRFIDILPCGRIAPLDPHRSFDGIALY
jgi:hypothetical protein